MPLVRLQRLKCCDVARLHEHAVDTPPILAGTDAASIGQYLQQPGFVQSDGLDTDGAIHVSAKTGEGVPAVLQALIARSQERVSGTVRCKLYKGSVLVVGRKSLNSLYDQEMATFEEDTVYHQADAEGFIKLNALRLRLLKRGGSS